MIVCTLNRLFSEFLAIGSHFRLFINISIGRSVDRWLEMVHRLIVRSSSCGTTQFDYHHLRLYLATHITLYSLLQSKPLIYRHLFEISIYSTTLELQLISIRTYRRIVAQTYRSTSRAHDKQKLTKFYIGQFNKIDTLGDQHIMRVEDLVCETGDNFLYTWLVSVSLFFLVSRHRKTYCVWSRLCSVYVAVASSFIAGNGWIYGKISASSTFKPVFRNRFHSLSLSIFRFSHYPFIHPVQLWYVCKMRWCNCRRFNWINQILIRICNVR